MRANTSTLDKKLFCSWLISPGTVRNDQRWQREQQTCTRVGDVRLSLWRGTMQRWVNGVFTKMTPSCLACFGLAKTVCRLSHWLFLVKLLHSRQSKCSLHKSPCPLNLMWDTETIYREDNISWQCPSKKIIKIKSISNIKLRAVHTSGCCCLLSHNAQRLFWPAHIDKERVGFDLIHTCHACSQSFHWIVLEQLRRTKKNY